MVTMTGHDDHVCPFCGSDDVRGNGFDFVGGNVARDDIWCPECGGEWFNIYSLTGIEIITSCPMCGLNNVAVFDNDPTSGRFECEECRHDWAGPLTKRRSKT